MIGLSVENDQGFSRHGALGSHKKSYKFAERLTGRFFVSGISGSLEKHSKFKAEIDSKYLKKEPKYTYEPVLEKRQKEELRKEAQRLVEMEEQLQEIQRRKEMRRQRDRSRRKRKMEYTAAVTIQRFIKSVKELKAAKASNVILAFLKMVAAKQAISVRAWAISVLRKFARRVTRRWKQWIVLRNESRYAAKDSWSLIQEIASIYTIARRSTADKLMFDVMKMSMKRAVKLIMSVKKSSKMKLKKERSFKNKSSSNKKNSVKDTNNAQFFLTEFDSPTPSRYHASDNSDSDTSIYSHNQHHHNNGSGHHSHYKSDYVNPSNVPSYNHSHHHQQQQQQPHHSSNRIAYHHDSSHDDDDDNNNDSDGDNNNNHDKGSSNYQRRPKRPQYEIIKRGKSYSEQNEKERKVIELHKKKAQDMEQERLHRLEMLEQYKKKKEHELLLKQQHEMEHQKQLEVMKANKLKQEEDNRAKLRLLNKLREEQAILTKQREQQKKKEAMEMQLMRKEDTLLTMYAIQEAKQKALEAAERERKRKQIQKQNALKMKEIENQKKALQQSKSHSTLHHHKQQQQQQLIGSKSQAVISTTTTDNNEDDNNNNGDNNGNNTARRLQQVAEEDVTHTNASAVIHSSIHHTAIKQQQQRGTAKQQAIVEAPPVKRPYVPRQHLTPAQIAHLEREKQRKQEEEEAALAKMKAMEEERHQKYTSDEALKRSRAAMQRRIALKKQRVEEQKIAEEEAENIKKQKLEQIKEVAHIKLQKAIELKKKLRRERLFGKKSKAKNNAETTPNKDQDDDNNEGDDEQDDNDNHDENEDYDNKNNDNNNNEKDDDEDVLNHFALVNEDRNEQQQHKHQGKSLQISPLQHNQDVDNHDDDNNDDDDAIQEKEKHSIAVGTTPPDSPPEYAKITSARESYDDMIEHFEFEEFVKKPSLMQLYSTTEDMNSLYAKYKKEYPAPTKLRKYTKDTTIPKVSNKVRVKIPKTLQNTPYYSSYVKHTEKKTDELTNDGKIKISHPYLENDPDILEKQQQQQQEQEEKHQQHHHQHKEKSQHKGDVNNEDDEELDGASLLEFVSRARKKLNDAKELEKQRMSQQQQQQPLTKLNEESPSHQEQQQDVANSDKEDDVSVESRSKLSIMIPPIASTTARNHGASTNLTSLHSMPQPIKFEFNKAPPTMPPPAAGTEILHKLLDDKAGGKKKTTTAAVTVKKAKKDENFIPRTSLEAAQHRGKQSKLKQMAKVKKQKDQPVVQQIAEVKPTMGESGSSGSESEDSVEDELALENKIRAEYANLRSTFSMKLKDATSNSSFHHHHHHHHHGNHDGSNSNNHHHSSKHDLHLDIKHGGHSPRYGTNNSFPHTSSVIAPWIKSKSFYEDLNDTSVLLHKDDPSPKHNVVTHQYYGNQSNNSSSSHNYVSNNNTTFSLSTHHNAFYDNHNVQSSHQLQQPQQPIPFSQQLPSSSHPIQPPQPLQQPLSTRSVTQSYSDNKSHVTTKELLMAWAYEDAEEAAQLQLKKMEKHATMFDNPYAKDNVSDNIKRSFNAGNNNSGSGKNDTHASTSHQLSHEEQMNLFRAALHAVEEEEEAQEIKAGKEPTPKHSIEASRRQSVTQDYINFGKHKSPHNYHSPSRHHYDEEEEEDDEDDDNSYIRQNRRPFGANLGDDDCIQLMQNLSSKIGKNSM